ncbi:MAG: radical SAM protein [Planctomycetota bacterium]|nr:radical SAM protein [Planctomycetota bacterium]
MNPPHESRAAAGIPRASKDELTRGNRARLDQDLVTQRLVWQSMPRVVDLQLSNFCNMSCTMCYDGANPPLEKLDTALVERFAAEVLPTASVVVPFAGSEPLILTWDLTKQLAERYGVELELITNAQFLDEAKFFELEPHVSTLTFSIDSHMLDVYERIRLRSKPKKVFENLPRAARLCREHGIEPQANVVFMVENAPYMDETVAFLADQGCTTVRMLAYHHPRGASADRAFSDAVRHMTPEWLAWMLGKVKKVAAEKRIHVIFEGLTRENSDHRPKDLGLRPDGKGKYATWDELPYYFPGYCVLSVDRIKVSSNGDVHPCCVAGGDDLRLGNLQNATFQEIWNGPTSQDLRRAMLTHDLPGLCRNCNFHTAWIPPELEQMPFVDWYHDVHCGGTIPRVPKERCTLVVDGPAHMARSEASPMFQWQAPAEPVDEYHLVFGIAGTWHKDNKVFTIPGDAIGFRIPDAEWMAMPQNLGLWWCLWAVRKNDLAASGRAATVRCLVRHQTIPRVPGSTLYG